MSAETVKIESFPSEAVEWYRRNHAGFLPSQRREWIVAVTTAIDASLLKKVTAVEIADLRDTALKAEELEASLTAAQAEIAALRKDAERYPVLVGAWLHGDTKIADTLSFCQTGEQLDAAIDASKG